MRKDKLNYRKNDRKETRKKETKEYQFRSKRITNSIKFGLTSVTMNIIFGQFY